jgi:hypothetical protein
MVATHDVDHQDQTPCDDNLSAHLTDVAHVIRISHYFLLL